jgi:hypothetical protein
MDFELMPGPYREEEEGEPLKIVVDHKQRRKTAMLVQVSRAIRPETPPKEEVQEKRQEFK